MRCSPALDRDRPLTAGPVGSRLGWWSVLLAGALLFGGCEKPRVDPSKLGVQELTEEEIRMKEALEDPSIYQLPEEDPEEEAPFVLNRGAQVSVLGYHDFSESRATDMIITAEKFRSQMQAIADAELPVISMEEFLAWRRGEANIPDYCILITIDDGWLGTHTYALPILKEFGFPFTCFLYTNYVNIGGRSMTIAQIQELIEAGAEIGSHSIAHASMTRRGNRSEEAYQQWLRDEFLKSKEWLEERLKVKVRTFAYPFGSYNNAIAEMGLELGYEALFTVNGAKVSWDTPAAELGRFIIHGNHDGNFALATTFRGRGALVASEMVAGISESTGGDATGATAVAVEPRVRVWPEPDSLIGERMPRIEVDFSEFTDVDPESLTMSITGLGSVFVQYDPERRRAWFQIPSRLRNSECRVVLGFARNGQRENVAWRFRIDPYPLYLGEDGVSPLKGNADAAADRAAGEVQTAADRDRS